MGQFVSSIPSFPTFRASSDPVARPRRTERKRRRSRKRRNEDLVHCSWTKWKGDLAIFHVLGLLLKHYRNYSLFIITHEKRLSTAFFSLRDFTDEADALFFVVENEENSDSIPVTWTGDRGGSRNAGPLIRIRESTYAP